MEVIRGYSNFKIRLPPYKINLKELRNKDCVNYQYSITLPPILCSMFGVKEGGVNVLSFYTWDNKLYISDPSGAYRYDENNNCVAKGFTTAYQLKNSNNFRVTLPNHLFKSEIKPTKDNYILFTIDTVEEDFRGFSGVVNVEIIRRKKGSKIKK